MESTNKKPTPEDVKALNNSDFLELQTGYKKGIKVFQESLKIPTAIEQEEILAKEISEQKKGIGKNNGQS